MQRSKESDMFGSRTRFGSRRWLCAFFLGSLTGLLTAAPCSTPQTILTHTIAPLDLNINSNKFHRCKVQVNTTLVKWKRKEMCVRISWLTFLLALGSLTGDRNMLQAARAALHTRQLAQQTVWKPDIQTFSTQKKPAHKKTDG